MSGDPDVIVVGAGIAGLSAALALTRAGLSVDAVERLTLEEIFLTNVKSAKAGAVLERAA